MKRILLISFWFVISSWYAYFIFYHYAEQCASYDYIFETHLKIQYASFANVAAITSLNCAYMILKRNGNWWKLVLIGLFTDFLIFFDLVGIGQI